MFVNMLLKRSNIIFLQIKCWKKLPVSFSLSLKIFFLSLCETMQSIKLKKIYKESQINLAIKRKITLAIIK